MQLSELQDGMIDRLRSIPKLTVVKVELPTIVVPMALVRPASISYNATMGRGSDDVVFSVVVYASKADAATGFDELHEYAAGHGPRSVRTALEASLGANDPLNDCMIRVDSADLDSTTIGGGGYLTATFAVLTTIDGA